MELDELKTKSADDLKKIMIELKADLRTIKFKIASGDLKTVHRLAEIKKTIARIMTLQNQK